MIVVDHAVQERPSWRPGNQTRLNIGAATGAERLCIAEQWFEPGTGAPTHTHGDVEETITVLAGAARFWCDDEQAVLGPQMTVILPPFSHHGFENTGPDELHIWAAYSVASVPTEYDQEPETTFAIGGTEGIKVDATRTKKG